MSAKWIPKSFDEACRRAAGRRRYHAQRREQQQKRQLLVSATLLEMRWQSYGLGKKLAASLHVDAATISRDIRFIQEWRATLVQDLRQPIGAVAAEKCADIIIGQLLTSQRHPKQGYTYSVSIREGALTVRT